MINFSKYDIVIVKFPFASSLKYKARPAVIISTDDFNKSSRKTLLILAISSQTESKIHLESILIHWKTAGLLKPSIFKSSIATISQEYVLQKLGTLKAEDIKLLNTQLQRIC